MTALLPAVAGWDVPLLRGAVGTLDLVTDRLTAWRARAEAVGRALEAARCWSGPAATQAAGAVLDLSETVVTGAAGLRAAVAEFSRMVAAAEEAQEAAAAALATAPGQAAGVESLADRAIAAAAVVADAATAAGQALRPVPERASPIDLLDLPRPGPGPVVPVDRSPDEVADWWASLSAAEQRRLVVERPEDVGDLDGVPAWARDRANRLVLDAALATSGRAGEGTARAVAAEIHRQEAAGRSVQLWTLDLDDDLAALAVGDLDTADAVAVLVPGIETTPEDDVAAQVGNAADVADRAGAAAPGLAVAALAWIGYRTPRAPLSILTRGDARAGGASLDRALEGLAAARTALAEPAPRTTVVAHSYGTVVLDEAAAGPGPLAADAVVLLGSPGGAADAAALEVPHVYDAFSPGDPISWVHWFGPNPWAARFGATELPTDPDTLHSQYFDPDRPTLDAIAHVVAGR